MKRDMNRDEKRIQWVLMNLRLSGSAMDMEQAARIAGGEYVLEASLEEHLLVTNLLEALTEIERILGLEEELCEGTLQRFYKVFSDGEGGVFRKRTPILTHLSYNPVLPQEIEEELARLFRGLHAHPVVNGLEAAVHVHNELIRIYPFDRFNELIARAAMEYELLYCGLDLYPLTLSESEYNGALAKYMRFGKEGEILENLKLNKLMAESKEASL